MELDRAGWLDSDVYNLWIVYLVYSISHVCCRKNQRSVEPLQQDNKCLAVCASQHIHTSLVCDPWDHKAVHYLWVRLFCSGWCKVTSAQIFIFRPQVGHVDGHIYQPDKGGWGSEGGEQIHQWIITPYKEYFRISLKILPAANLLGTPIYNYNSPAINTSFMKVLRGVDFFCLAQRGVPFISLIWIRVDRLKLDIQFFVWDYISCNFSLDVHRILLYNSFSAFPVNSASSSTDRSEAIEIFLARLCVVFLCVCSCVSVCGSQTDWLAEESGGVYKKQLLIDKHIRK